MTAKVPPTPDAPSVPFTGYNHPDAVSAKQAFAILTADPAELKEVLDVNLCGQTLDAFKLASVKVPSGGQLAWTVTTLEDGETVVPVLIGIIIHIQNGRVYWVNPDATGVPPDCRSMDGIHGDARDPDSGICPDSGLCADCPYSKFETAARGRGQACKQKAYVFYMDSESYMPTLLSVPPTSLGALDAYKRALSAKALPYFGAITQFSLEKKRSADNKDYSAVVFTPVVVKDGDRKLIVRLTPDEKGIIAGALRAQIQDAMKALPAPLADATETPEAPGEIIDAE